MSALSKINAARPQPLGNGAMFDEFRDKVAGLIRSERTVARVQQHVQAVPKQENQVVQPVAGKTEPAAAERDLSVAFEVIDRAKSLVSILVQKIEQLEKERDEALSMIEAHERAAGEWQDMIQTVQSRMLDAERDLTKMHQDVVAERDRAFAAEDRAAQLDSTLKTQERMLSEAEKKFSTLYDQVTVAFGFGSSTLRHVETLAARFHAKAA